MPLLSKKKYTVPSKKNIKPTFKSPINYKENISKLLNNNEVTSKKPTLPRDEKYKKTIKKTLNLSISFESNSEVVKSKTSQATPDDTFNSSSQLDDSDVDSILSKEILNRKEIKDKYLQFWKENLTPELENEFKELSQQLNEKPKTKESKPKKEKPKKIAKKAVIKDDLYEKMCSIQESRNQGLYVICDSCDKHRYLPDIKDPLDLPDKWFCWMNPDTKHNTCEAREVVIDPEEEEFLICNLYNAGSIVWAKMDGYPWWPAMVDDDPDTEDYFWLEDTLEPTYYHVTFFDSSEVTRAWMKPCDLKAFARNVDNPQLVVSKYDKFKRRVDVAVQQAKDAVKLPLIERLRKYSFIQRYKKPLGKLNRGKIGRKTKKSVDEGGKLQAKKRKIVNSISSDEDIQNSNFENNLSF